MANGRDTRQIRRIRNEILVALKVVYPAALQAEQLMRSLLVLFPTLEVTASNSCLVNTLPMNLIHVYL